MRKLLFLIAIIIFPNLLKAQLNSFDLSSYKLPVITRHQLDFNFDLNGSTYKTDQSYRIRQDNYRKSNNMSGNIDLDYIFYKNSDKIQSKQFFSIDFAPSFSDSKDKDDLIRESSDLILASS